MNQSIKKEKNIIKRIFIIGSWVLTGILLLLVVLLLVFGFSSMKQGKMVKIFGYSYSVIVSPSMEPTINVNDIILIDTKADFKSIKDNGEDIIVFYNPNENKNIAHRVIGKYSDGSLKTCGDNNNGLVDTFPVTEEYYLGKVVKYGKCLGLGSLIINGRMVFFIALAAIFLYIVVSEFINLYKLIMNKKHEDRMKQIKENKQKQEEQLRAQLKEELRKELEAQNKK